MPVYSKRDLIIQSLTKLSTHLATNLDLVIINKLFPLDDYSETHSTNNIIHSIVSGKPVLSCTSIIEGYLYITNRPHIIEHLGRISCEVPTGSLIKKLDKSLYLVESSIAKPKSIVNLSDLVARNSSKSSFMMYLKYRLKSLIGEDFIFYDSSLKFLEITVNRKFEDKDDLDGYEILDELYAIIMSTASSWTTESELLMNDRVDNITLKLNVTYPIETKTKSAFTGYYTSRTRGFQSYEKSYPCISKMNNMDNSLYNIF